MLIKNITQTNGVMNSAMSCVSAVIVTWYFSIQHKVCQKYLLRIYMTSIKMGHQQRSYILYVLALALISILGQFLVPNFIFIMLKLSVKVSVQDSQFLIIAG